MSKTDLSLLQATNETDMGLLEATNDSSTMNTLPLTLEEQEYASQLSQELGTDTAAAVTTVDQYDDFNIRESIKLSVEDSMNEMARNIQALADGSADIKTVQESAKKSAVESHIAETNGLYAGVERSLNRQDLALSDLENPENLTMGERYRIAQARLSEKRAILEHMTNMYAYDSAKASTGSALRYFANQILPIDFDERTFAEALDALDIESSLLNPVENKERFVRYIANLYGDNEISTADFYGIMLSIRQRMHDAGVSPEAATDLFDQVLDYSPDMETFWTVADVAGLASIPAKTAGGAVKGAKAGINLADAAYTAIKEGTKGALKGAVEQIPLGETAVRVASKIPLIAKPTRKVGGILDKAITRAIKADNMSEASRLVADAVGEPTVHASAVFEHSTPSVAKGIENAGESLSETPEVVTKNVKLGQANMDIQRRIKMSPLKRLKELVWNNYAPKLADTLHLEDVIGKGRGVSTSDFIAAFEKGDVLQTQKGDLVVRVRTKGSYKSVLDGDGNDLGRASAVKRANNLSGDNGVTATVAKVNGRWRIELDINTKKGWGTLGAEYLEDLGQLKRKGWRGWLSSIFTPTSNPTDISQWNELRHLEASSLMSEMEAVSKNIDALNKDEKALLNHLGEMSLRYNAWYDPEILRARGASEKTVKAYQAIREFNDLDFFVINEARRTWMQERGMKSYSFAGQMLHGYGREVKATSAKELWEISQKRYIIKDSTNSEEMLDGIGLDVFTKDYEKGYRLIEITHGPDETTKARDVYYWLNPDQIIVKDLPEIVTNYVAGGRRFFDRQAGFVKQIVLKTNKNNREVIAGLQTFATDRDIQGLIKRTDLIESIRVAVAKGELWKANDIITSCGVDNIPFKNADEFMEWADSMGIDYLHEQNALEVVRNGQALSSYNKLATKDDLIGPEDMYNLQHRSSFQAITNEQRLAKARRTGKDLYTYNFEKAVPVDFEEQLRYMVNDMIYNGTMKDFTDFYAERFDKAFRSVMTINERGPVPTAQELLLKGNVKQYLADSPNSLASAARAAQKNYFSIRGVPSDLDSYVGHNISSAIRWVGNAVPELLHLSDTAAHKVRLGVESLLDKDPLRYMRTATSHWYLGMFNVSQLYKQSASLLAVYSIEPRAAMQASRYILPFSTALRRADGNVYKAFDYLANKLGDAPKNVRQNYESLVDMGAFTHGVSGGMIEAAKTTEGTLSKLSMLPFSQGEMMNRVGAYLTAIYAKGYDGIKMNAQQLAEVTSYAQKLFLHMDATGLSRIQTSSVGKTLLQFLSYRIKWVETVLFEKELTKAQRARLALVNSLLVGTEGMLGVGATTYMSNLFRSDEDKEQPAYEDKTEFAKFIQRGLLNYVSEASSMDIDFGAPWELSLFELANTIIDISDLELPSTTATGSMLGGIANAIATAREWVSGDITYEDFQDMLAIVVEQGGAPSSIKNAWLGWSLYDTGKMFNAKGELTEEDNDRLRGVLKMLGLNSLDVKERSRSYHEYRLAQGDIDKVFKELQPLFNECTVEFSEGKWKVFVNALQNSGLSTRGRKEVLDRLQKQTKSTYIPASTRVLLQQLKAGGEKGNNQIIKLMEK